MQDFPEALGLVLCCVVGLSCSCTEILDDCPSLHTIGSYEVVDILRLDIDPTPEELDLIGAHVEVTREAVEIRHQTKYGVVFRVTYAGNLQPNPESGAER